MAEPSRESELPAEPAAVQAQFHQTVDRTEVLANRTLVVLEPSVVLGLSVALGLPVLSGLPVLPGLPVVPGLPAQEPSEPAQEAAQEPAQEAAQEVEREAAPVTVLEPECNLAPRAFLHRELPYVSRKKSGLPQRHYHVSRQHERRLDAVRAMAHACPHGRRALPHGRHALLRALLHARHHGRRHEPVQFQRRKTGRQASLR